LCSKILSSDSPSVLLSAWEALLARLSGQSAFSVGFQANGREYEELANAVGCFARILPLAAQVDNNLQFAETLGQTEQVTRDAVGVQEYFPPEAIGTNGNVVAFAYQDFGAKQDFAGVGFTLERVHVISEPYKLRLVAVRRGSELELEFHYDAARFERSAVERIAGYYVNLLTAALANPSTQVSRLPLLSDSERRQLLVAWNQTSAEYPKTQCLHELFEQQAAKTPERVAVRSGEQTLPYPQVNQRSNQLAHHLRQPGVAPHRPLPPCPPRPP